MAKRRTKAVTTGERGSPKQEAFIRHVVEGENPTAAARKAGYSPVDAKRRASKLMKAPFIRARIDDLRGKVWEAKDNETVADALDIAEFLTSVMRGKQNAQMKDRLQASHQLGRILGLHVERREHTGANGQPIQFQPVVLSDADIEKRLNEIAARRLPSGK